MISNPVHKIYVRLTLSESLKTVHLLTPSTCITVVVPSAVQDFRYMPFLDCFDHFPMIIVDL